MKSANKRIVIKIIVTFAALSCSWFVWYSTGLYQERLAAEADIGKNNLYSSLSADEQGVVTFEGKTYERNPSIKAILFIGVDSSGDMDQKVSGSGGQADGVFLAAYNAASDTARVLMIPRDTMTPITMTDLGGNVLGKTKHHLTLAYAYGDGKELSCERTCEAVSELLGLSIDGYLAMNTNLIGQLNDMAGGVTVTVQVDGMEKRDIALTKGSTVKLRGEQAEIFVRYRDINVEYSAITRMSQQKQYMEAYLSAVKAQAAEDNQVIVDIMNLIEDRMITNMSKPQYMEMGTAFLTSKEGFNGDDLLIIPGEAVTVDRFDEFHHDPEGTQKMVLDLFYREK